MTYPASQILLCLVVLVQSVPAKLGSYSICLRRMMSASLLSDGHSPSRRASQLLRSLGRRRRKFSASSLQEDFTRRRSLFVKSASVPRRGRRKPPIITNYWHKDSEMLRRRRKLEGSACQVLGLRALHLSNGHTKYRVIVHKTQCFVLLVHSKLNKISKN